MWKIIRASVVGTSHIDSGQLCQDSCFADVFQGIDSQEYLICIVSDGAGSAKLGGAGAELACTSAIKSIEASLSSHRWTSIDETLIEEWIKDIQHSILETAAANGLTSREYACTLLGAVVGPDDCIFFQIGDGAIVAASGCTQGVVFWPDSGMYANMTFFVTEEDALSHLQVSITKAHIEEIAVFTDGIQRLALSFEQRIPHGPFFEPMLSVLRMRTPEECEILNDHLVKFLSSPQVNRYTDDDKTLVLATRRVQ